MAELSNASTIGEKLGADPLRAESAQGIQLARVYDQLDDLEEQNRQMKSSLSWRLTKPIRIRKALAGYVLSWIPFLSHKLFLTSTSPSDAVFEIRSSLKLLPNSWIELRLPNGAVVSEAEGTLYIDSGSGFSQEECLELKLSKADPIVCKLPAMVRSLRLDATTHQEDNVVLEAKQKYSILVALSAIRKFGLVRSLQELFQGGKAGLRQALFFSLESHYLINSKDKRQLYQCWIDQVESKLPADLPANEERLFSVIMPVFNTSPVLLRDAIESVLRQSYKNWELCIVDDGSKRSATKDILDTYASLDDRIKVHVAEENLGISASSNKAFEMASGEFVVLLDHDDVLAKDALSSVAYHLEKSPSVKVIFSDEDRLTQSGERLDPYFKPGWNRILLREQNLVSHLGVFRRELVKQLGGFRKGYEGSQDWDLALRATDTLEDTEILHIPRVLYHWRIEPRSVSTAAATQGKAFTSGIRAVRDSLRRNQIAIIDVPTTSMGKAELAPIDSAFAVVYLDPSRILSGRDLWNEEVSDLQVDYVCFLCAESDSDVDSLARKLQAQFQDSQTGIAGGLVLDSRGGIIDGLYSYSDNVFQALRFPYKKVMADRTLGAKRSVGLVSPFCLMTKRDVVQSACQNSELPFVLALTRYCSEQGLRTVLAPDAAYALRSIPELPLAFQVGPEIKDYHNPNLALTPYSGLRF